MDAILIQMREQLTEAAETAAPDRDITFRPMFGGICGYVDGRVFASLYDGGLALKLAPADQPALLSLPGAKRLRYEPNMPESKVSIVIPPDVRADADTLAPWVGKSVTYVMSLPAPKKRATKGKGA